MIENFENNKELAFFLTKIAEHNRFLASDNLIKSSAPNANELCTKKLDFKELMHKISTEKDLSSTNIKKALEDSSSPTKVSSSVRLSSIEFADAVNMNSAMNKLLRFSIREKSAVVDGFKPS